MNDYDLQMVKEAWTRNEPADVIFVWQYVEAMLEHIGELQECLERGHIPTRCHAPAGCKYC